MRREIARVFEFDNEKEFEDFIKQFEPKVIDQNHKDLTVVVDTTQKHIIKNQKDNKGMTRQQYNYEILNDISTLIEKYPDQRFGQILANYVFPSYRTQDFFYEEPSETVKRTAENVARFSK